jgi:hypothetical protein
MSTITTTFRFNQVDTEPLYAAQLKDLPAYYHSYKGYSTQNTIIFIPFGLYNASESGTVDFSALQTFEFKPSSDLALGNYLYSVRYNVLKFENGAAALAYE